MSNIDPTLRCVVCTEYYESPKSLSCGHTFCSSCCLKLTNERTITCPVCRRNTNISPEGLPMNYAIKDAVSKHRSGEFSIRIVPIGGGPFALPGIHTWDDVCDVKQKVANHEGLAESSFYLVHGGKCMKDGYDLEEYGIKAGATIHACGRLKGGNAQ